MSRAISPPPQPTPWSDYLNILATTPLVVSDTLTLPATIPNNLRRLLSAAHFQGLTCGSTGTWMAPEIPELTNNDELSAATQAIYAHFQASFYAGANTRLRALTPAPPPPRTLAPKIADPTPFDGTRDKYRQFITQLQLVFSSDPTRYSQDSGKISYAASHLSGSAQSWFNPHMDPVSGEVQFQSYEEFINALQAAFDDPDAEATAREKLDKLCQGKRDCSTYAAEFVTISTKLSMNQKE